MARSDDYKTACKIAREQLALIAYDEIIRRSGFKEIGGDRLGIAQLRGLIEYLETLKELILSPKQYEIKEEIYRKRHFTIDIPSMYGRYHEVKFDALGLMLRIEAMVNVLFETLVEQIDLTLITKATFFRLYDLLQLFGRALKLDGIPTMEFD